MLTLRYIFSGFLVAILYYTSLYCLINVEIFDLSISILIAYLISAILRFILHFFFVFKKNVDFIKSYFPRYIFLLISSYSLNFSITYFISQQFEINNLFLTFISTVVISLYAYFLSLKWVFK